MRYLPMIIAVLLGLSVQGCVTDKNLTPPDSILNPRGE